MKHNNTSMRKTIQGVAIASAVMMLALSATGQEQPDLKTRVDQLEQQLRILKRQLELDKESATERAQTTPLITAGSDGFAIRSADTNFVLRLRGTIQAD